MVEIGAIPTEGVEGVTVTDDGEYAIFKFKMQSPGYPAIGVPTNTLLDLMSLAAHASGQAAQIRQQDRSLKQVFQTEWWEVSQQQDGELVVMSFRLPGGVEFSFQVHRNAAIHFRDVLDTLLGKAPMPDTETPRH